jgi:hypothetical protein
MLLPTLEILINADGLLVAILTYGEDGAESFLRS